VVSTPAGVTVVAATGVTATGVYDITLALDSLVPGKTYHGIACANHLAADIADAKVHIANVGDPGVKRWTMVHFGEPGSVSTATTLATGGNDPSVLIAAYKNAKNTPGEVAAAFACAQVAIEDPAANFDGLQLPLYPVDAPDAYTNPEIETLLAAGVTPLLPTEDGTTTQIVRNVTTKTVENSVPFEPLLDASAIKIAYYTGTQMDIAQRIAFQGLDAKFLADLDKRVKDVAYDVLKKLEALQILRDVDLYKKEIRFEQDLTVATRGNLAYPIPGVPNLHQLANVGNLITVGS
jgi:phage tail sheath gpL-like